jgi:hypothetical protein
MTDQSQGALTLSELPWLAAAGLVPGLLFIQHWEPCDSIAAIASGDSMLYIGLTLILGVCVGAGVALQPASVAEPLTAGSSSFRTRRMWIAMVFACFSAIAWLAMATIAEAGRGNLRFAVNGFWQWTSMLVWGVSICWLARRPGFARLAITAAMAWGIGMLVYGFWEYGVIQPELRRQLEQDPVGLFKRQGIALESPAGLLLADRIRSTEMKGVYALANSYGGFLACYWVLVLSAWSTRRSRAWIALVSILLVVIGIALLLTKSRTAWIAAGVGTVLLIWNSSVLRERFRGRSLAIAGVAAIAMAAIGLGIVYRFDPLILQEAGKSLAYRFDYWRGAMSLIASEPWFGYGVGSFQSTYLHVKLPTAAESPADPHNFLLEVAHAAGIPCLLLVATGLGLALWFALFGSTNPLPQYQKESPSRLLSVSFWLGGVLGCLSLIAWSLMVDSDERQVGALIAFAASAIAGGVGSRWSSAITSAQLLVQNRPALGIAFAVVLVHLLASGGWLLPGTMSLTMLAVGLCLGGVCTSESVHSQEGSSIEGRIAMVRFGGVGIAAVLLVAWYATMALPISRGLEKARVLGGGVNNPSPRQVVAIATEDRWDPELARLGVDWAVGQLSRPMGWETRRDWEQALEGLQKMLEDRDPQNNLVWDASGQASVRAAATAGDLQSKSKWLKRADQAFERASQCSPASAQGHVQAALAASWVGDWERCQKHCAEAEEIDSSTPHRDRKITYARVVWPKSLEPSSPGLGADAYTGGLPDQVKAEPVLHYLRSQPKP